MPRALLSVSDKTEIVELGRGLVARGYELVSTVRWRMDDAGATAIFARLYKITPVGAPEG